MKELILVVAIIAGSIALAHYREQARRSAVGQPVPAERGIR